MAKRIQPGRPFPLGSSPCRQGVNFSVFANKAEAVELLFFDAAEDSQPREVIRLDPLNHNTHNYWHVCVAGIQPGQIYAYRAIGPYLPEHGLRYDSQKVLLDPYARAIAVPERFSRRQPPSAATTALPH